MVSSMPHAFAYRNNELFCERVSLSDIASQLGTPAFVYSAHSLRERFREFSRGLSDIAHTICFSAKSNSNGALLQLLSREGAGSDIVSGGELFRSLRAGIPRSRIVYSGAGKTPQELAFALEHNIYMYNVESESELDTLAVIAARMQKRARISLRINPDIDAHTHSFTTTAKKENKFGIPRHEAVDIYKKAQSYEWIEPVGIDVHLGSPLTLLSPYREAIAMFSELIPHLRSIGIDIQVLDIGGGYGVTYKDETPFTVKDFCALIKPFVREHGLHLIVEPGRYIAAEAGALLTRITYVKKAYDKIFYICDTGMNDLIRPPLYDAWHEIKPVSIHDGDETECVDVVGPICESSDFFALQRTLPRQHEGDLLAVLYAGAYGITMASNYNSHPRACEVLVDDTSFHCIRRRETYEDLVRHEILEK